MPEGLAPSLKPVPPNASYGSLFSTYAVLCMLMPLDPDPDQPMLPRQELDAHIRK